jgi:aspartyl-tRNA(Asn)/glutamyl-tRNA(Gln) amidotransferase subunit B
MPAERRARLRDLVGHDGAAPTHAQDDQIATVVEHGLDSLVLASVDSGVDAPLAIARTANEAAAAAGAARAADPAAYAALLLMEQEGKLSATQAKSVLSDLLENGGDPADIARRKGFEALETESLVETVRQVVAANPAEWERYRTGEDKLAQFFIGQVMKATSGKANGKAVVAELQRLRS